MPFLTKIISGGPGLLIAFALCLIVIKARLINLPKPCSSTCSLFFRRCIFLLLQYSASIIRKRQFLDSPAGPSLPSAFYSSGDLPVVKSNRPDVFAFLSGSAKKAGFLLGIFVLLSFANASAATITSTRAGGNWNDPATWVGGTVPSTGDDVTITSGARVVIDSDAVVGTLTVSGILQYDSSAAYTLTATEFITVNAEGVFRSAQSGAITNHRLIAHGSIINNGTIDFSSNANETGVELVFTGPGNAIFNCSDAVLTNLRQENGITLNKGKSAASVLSFIPGRAFQVLSDGNSNAKGFLTIENGTFNVIGSKDFRNPVFGADGTYTIPATGGFWLGNQNAEITGMNGDIVIQGELKITNGIFNAGTSGGNSLKTEGNGNLKISGGVVNVAGKLHIDGGVFSISGGRLNLAMLLNSANNEPTFEVSPKAKLEIFGNPLITITYPNSGQTLANDIQILEGRGSKFISGGVIQLGTEATPAQSIFLVNAERIIPYLNGFSECSTIAYNTSKADVATTQVAALPRIALDKTAPEITAPEKITIKCGETLPTAYASLSEFTKAGGVVSDNCALNPADFKLVKEVRSKTICPYIVTRTYEIADASGNTATADQKIYVEGTIAEPQPEPIAGQPIAQELKLKSATVDFTAVKSGDWDDPATWSSTVIPTSADNVTIPGPHTVTVDAAAFCNNITIQAGGTLTITGTNTLQVNASWTNNGTFLAGTGTVVFKGNTNNNIISGSSASAFYNIIIDKGTDVNTVIEANGTGALSNTGNLTLTNGLFKMTTGTFQFTSNPNIPVSAGFWVNGATLSCVSASSLGFSIDNSGKIKVSAGILNVGTASGNSAITTSNGDFELSGSGTVNTSGRFKISGGNCIISGGTMNIATVGHADATEGAFHITATANLSISGNPLITFTHPNSNAVPFNDIEIVGTTGKSIMGGTFQMGTASTLLGSTFKVNSDIPVFNFTVFNSYTSILLTNNLTVKHQLNLNDGIIDGATNNQNIILTNSNASALNNSTGYIIGNLRREIATGSNTYLFPVGTASGYTPVSLSLNGVSSIGNITVSSNDGAVTIPTNLKSTSRLNRHWDITSSGLGSYTTTGTYTYLAGDLFGGATQPNLKIYQISPPSSISYPSFSTGANSFTASNLTTFGEFGAAECGTITIGGNLTMVSCNGGNNGAIDITVTGGAAPFTYSWSGPGIFTSLSQNISNLIAGTYNITVTDDAGCTGTNSFIITEPAIALSATTSQVDVKCKGNASGTATAVGANGTGPYTYSWNTSPVQSTATATGLIAGTYIVTVTDANLCAITKSVTITEPAIALSATTSQVDVKCKGNATGTATAVGANGTGPYTYSWNTSPVQSTATATGLIAGSYIVTVTDANLCSITKSVTITEPAIALSATTSQVDVKCKGNATGTATAVGANGTGPYTYSWNTSPVQSTATATGLIAGTYIVTVTDANLCAITKSVTITEPAIALSATTSQVDVKCKGNATGTATAVGANGTGPYTYSWNTSPVQSTATATGLIAGTYIVTVTDANLCSITKSVTITEPAIALSATTSQVDVKCKGNATGTATAVGANGTGPYTYSWNTSPVQSTATATGLIAGSYIVTVTDANLCSITKSVTITEPAIALSATTSQVDVKCKGNATGTATAVGANGTGPYTYSWNTSPVQSTATATGLIAGTYIVTVTDANLCAITKSVTITEPAIALSATTSQVDVKCKGNATGTATAVGANGTGPYTYSWNTSPVQSTATATGLIAGSYIVTVTDANLCAITKSVTITEPAALTAGAATSNRTTTYGTATGSATAPVPTGGTPVYFYTWNTIPVQNTQTATGLIAGIYTVTITDQNGCTITRTVTVIDAIDATISAASICTGKKDILRTSTFRAIDVLGGVGPYTYLWNFGANATPATSTLQGPITVTYTLPGDKTITLKVTDSTGASTTITTVHYVGECYGGCGSNDAEVNEIYLGDGSGNRITSANCGNVGLNPAIWIVFGGPTRYSLYLEYKIKITRPSTGEVFTDQNAICLYSKVAIPNPVKIINIPNWQCGDIIELDKIYFTVSNNSKWDCNEAPNSAIKCYSIPTIEILPIPLFASAVSTSILCKGAATGSIDVTASGGIEPYTYSKDGTTYQTSNIFNGLAAGIYTITVKDSKSPTPSTTTVSVTVSEPANLLTAITSFTSPICFGGSTGSATVTASGGIPGYTYSWNTIPVQTGATANGLKAGVYAVTVTDANNCQIVKTVTIIDPPQVTVVVNNPAAVCSPATVDLTLAAVTTGSTAGLAYTYFTDAAATIAYATPSAAGAGTYYIKGTTAAGCFDVKPVTVTVNPTPTVVVNNPAAVCSPATVDLTLAAVTTGSTAGLTYTYFTDAAATLSYTTPSTAVAGTYYIKGTTAAGCFDVKPVTVTVNPTPSCSISGLQNVFSGSNYTYTSTPVPADQVFHSWTISGNGTISGSTTNTTVTVTAGVAGTFTLRDDITRLGCTSYCTYDVTVISPCSISPAVGSVSNTTSTTYSAPAGMDTYFWTISGNGTIPSGITNQQTVTVLAGNTCSSYTLSLSMTKNGVTIPSCSQTVIVTDNIPPTFTPPDPFSGCVEDIAQAVYNGSVPQGNPLDMTYLRPDYYTFVSGDPGLDLDPAKFLDNCGTMSCTVEIRWKITMDNGTLIPAAPTPYLTGQPSAYGSDITFLCDPTNITTHTITYWIVDCVGNVSAPISQPITIYPRPYFLIQH